MAAAGDIFTAGDWAAGESGGAARRARLAPRRGAGESADHGEARSSADAALAGDGAPGEGDVSMAMWTVRARANWEPQATVTLTETKTPG